MSRLPPRPELSWSADGAPRARAFDDVYFSREGGLAESEAVFLAGCGLPDAWRGRARFSILELGFGAGLNALAVWRRWRETRAAGALLHFVSIEAFPMEAEDAARALAAFPELRPLAARLIEVWPVRAYAPQRVWFDEDGFALSVFPGAAEEVLPLLRGAFDSIFLDGFAPARNPDMWSDEIARRIAALSAPNARLASYSVAGGVRRALAQAGFAVEKRQGFAAKRERLEARRAEAPAPTHTLYPYRGEAPRRVAIVGGGIAGAAMARALARRGAAVTLYEAQDALGAGASGNRAALVMPRLDRGRGPLQELNLAAFLYAVGAYRADGLFASCGALERDRPDLETDPPLPSDWLAPHEDGVLHRHAGVVAPHAVLAAWTKQADVRLNARVAALAPAEEGWRLLDPSGAALGAADAVILANGAALDVFAQTRWLELRRTAGQLEWAPWKASAPAHALVGESYAALHEGALIFGATFDRVDEAQVSEAARRSNCAALARLAPELAAALDPAALRSRASVRAAAPDYAPLAGLAPDAAAWLAAQAGLAHGRPPDLARQAPAHDGLYLLGGLGARGFTLAPLMAERLAAELYGEPQICSWPACEAAHPARFLHRMLKKGLTTPASVKDDG